MTTTTNNTPGLVGQADEKQISDWKKKCPDGLATVKKSGRIAYFKVPSFADIDAYYGSAKKAGATVSDEWKNLAGLLWIGGDRELIDSPRYLPNVAKRLQELIAGEESELAFL